MNDESCLGASEAAGLQTCCSRPRQCCSLPLASHAPRCGQATTTVALGSHMWSREVTASRLQPHAYKASPPGPCCLLHGADAPSPTGQAQLALVTATLLAQSTGQRGALAAAEILEHLQAKLNREHQSPQGLTCPEGRNVLQTTIHQAAKAALAQDTPFPATLSLLEEPCKGRHPVACCWEL